MVEETVPAHGFIATTDHGILSLTMPDVDVNGRRGFLIVGTSHDGRVNADIYLSRQAMETLMMMYLYDFKQEDRDY